jgi:hypothetical protein
MAACRRVDNQTEPKSFCTDQNSHCIHTRHDQFTAFVLFADHIFLKNSPSIEEEKKVLVSTPALPISRISGLQQLEKIC